MFEKNCIFHKRKGGISNQLNEPKRKKLENPINVADYATLSSIGKKLPLNAAYLQTNNIIVPAGIFHQPIASTAAPFTGHYNGNGFKIINLCSQGERLALFDTVENALIERVKLDNAIFIGHGKKIKIAPFIIEAKGNSQIKHLNWLSGYIEILGNELDEGEVAGLIHTVAKSVLLTSAQSSGELVRHHLIPKKTKKGLVWPPLHVSGLVINNAGTLQNLERLPVIQSIYAYGVSKNNSGMMSKIKLGHVVGSTSAIGGCQLNEGTIKQISLGNIESEDYSCGLVSFNKGSIKKVAINKVSSGQRAYGLMWRNYGGQAEHVFINQVISQKVAYGIGQLNKKGIIRNIQINKIESEKIYGIVESNAENSHLEHILINTIQRLPQSEAEIYGWVGKNERSLLHHIYLNSFPATIKCPESLLTDEQVNCLFVSTKTDYMNHDKFIYVNSLDVEKVKNLLLKNHWDMQTNGSPLFVWYWSETGLALKKISINNRYQDAIKLLAIFRTLANPSNNPDGTTEIQSMPIDILASIADYLTVSSFSNLQRSNIIHYAFNKKTINHFNEFEQLLSPTLAPR